VIVGVVGLTAAYALVGCGDDDDSGRTQQPPNLDVPDITSPDQSTPEVPILDDGSGEPVPVAEVGPPTPPPTGVPELDDEAQGCFDGSMGDCDLLYLAAAGIQAENEAALDYTIYSELCGGRLEDTSYLDACAVLIPDP
jgi:hypothetical protein